MKNTGIIVKRIVLSTLTVLLIAFIFYNSSLDADSSSVHSFNIREILNSILSALNIEFVFTEHIVRKCAHFAEFFVLGTLLFYTARSYVNSLKKDIIIAPAVGLMVAVVDEFIQLFSAGRACQFTDVLLDFSGVCTAVIIFYTITRLLCKNIDKEVSN